MKVFYHADMDGHCSGAIVKRYKDILEKKEGLFDKHSEYIEIDYKDEFPFDKILKDEEIIIVDFSLQKEGDFDKLLEITKDVRWIDHHKTAIEKHNHLEYLKGVRNVDFAACELTWQYFFSNEQMPYVVQLLGDYDTWKFEYGNDTRYFQLGCKLNDTHPESDIWEDWFGGRVLNRYLVDIDNGKIMHDYKSKTNTSYVSSYAFFAEFEGYKAICCNSGARNSQLFDSIDKDTYDIMMPFVYDGKQWTVSIYSLKSDIDCGELAKKYGGGGHRGAAGFQIKELPFSKE